MWLTTQAFDGIIHYTLEGSFLYYSMFGRQVKTSSGPMAQMCTLMVIRSVVGC